ncbi:molybdate ABC transporter substrate-binding protein [Amphibacillus cookii]|uniref:molybdate ABC transporter substrate-binding protein n=1 Tax=Amphibacillus cookii TaxID=767787 RepID=UPI00195AABBD|nr:molybdate ABC transporter substrate-binding protein [Amphibacillus cookii]MBM7541908.1 molybdate transport system substrate-binding protein [Amphibacillus cookii]
MKKLLFIVIGFVFLVSCRTNDVDEANEGEIIISAAASLMGVMEELKNEFESIHDDITLTFNFASSGSLARQIQQGAPVDLFISANQEWMDILGREELIRSDSRIDVVNNKIVLVKSIQVEDKSISFDDLSERSELQIAIGDPETVPAGFYAKQVFEKLGIWQYLKDNIVYGKDVQQVRTYIETNSVDYAVLFLSDTYVTDDILILDIASPSWHDPIVYPAAITANSVNNEVTESFLDFIVAEEAEPIWHEYGFNQN